MTLPLDLVADGRRRSEDTDFSAAFWRLTPLTVNPRGLERYFSRFC